jgi:hypothetical protein
MAKPLRLIAQEPDEVTALSAALQDAVAKIGDFHYEPARRRFTLALNRYRWEAADQRRGDDKGERVRTAVQAGSVTAAKAMRLKQGAEEAVVSLLALSFEPGEPPGGALRFTFAGGGELRLEVECVDMVLADISEPWRAVRRPAHPDADTPGGQTSGRVDP